MPLESVRDYIDVAIASQGPNVEGKKQSPEVRPACEERASVMGQFFGPKVRGSLGGTQIIRWRTPFPDQNSVPRQT